MESVLDRAALEALYLRLERPLFNVVFRWVWNAEEARDLVQEAFVRLWNMRERVEIETVEPLAYRIALNLAANRRRANALRRWIGLEAASDVSAPPEGETLEERETAARVRAAVEALPERLRRVIALTELAGLSYAEAARTLEIPEGTVGSRRNHALKALEATLGVELGLARKREGGAA